MEGRGCLADAGQAGVEGGLWRPQRTKRLGLPGYSVELKLAVVGLGEGLGRPWELCLLPPRQLPHPDWASGLGGGNTGCWGPTVLSCMAAGQRPRKCCRQRHTQHTVSSLRGSQVHSDTRHGRTPRVIQAASQGHSMVISQHRTLRESLMSVPGLHT